MAARKNRKKKAANRGHHHHAKRSNSTRVVVVAPKAGNRRKANRSRNPMFFGSHASPVQVAQYMLGGLLGMGVNTIVLPLLPKPFTNSNLTATLSAFGLAFAEWWAASFIDKNFGAAVGFGALINAGRQGLNSFVPGVGSTFGLSGRRGTGDFVDARFAVPQNPIYDAYMGIDPGMAGRPGGVANAYPSAYAA